MMRIVPFILAALVCLGTVPARAESTVPPAADGSYTLDRSHATVTFRISHLGYSQYTGRFNAVDAALTLNAADPSKSQLTAKLTPSSIDVNNPELQDILRGAQYFNVTQFPEITFASTKIIRTARNVGLVTGDLTMLGVTKPMTMTVTFNDAKMDPYASVYAVGFSATATIKRSDWGMKTLIPQVGDEVILLIEAEFHKDKDK